MFPLTLNNYEKSLPCGSGVDRWWRTHSFPRSVIVKIFYRIHCVIRFLVKGKKILKIPFFSFLVFQGKIYFSSALLNSLEENK